MKKISKVLCIALSMMLIINLAGMETMASEVESTENSQQSSAESTPENDAASSDDSEAVQSDDTAVEGQEGSSQETGEAQESKQDETEALSENSLDPAESEEEQKDDVSTESLEEETYLKDLKVEFPGDNTVKLSWTIKDDENQIAGYDVELYTDEKKEEAALFAQKDVIKEADVADTAEVTFEKLQTGVTYYVSVKPYFISGSDSATEVLSSVQEKEYAKATETEAVILIAPKLSVKNSEETVTLTWESVANATAYEVYQKSGEVLNLISTVQKNSYSYKVAKNNVKYTYVVKAVAENAEPGVSNEVSVTPKTKTPGKVTGLSIMDGEKSAILTWSKVSGATSYKVYRYNASTKKWAAIKSTTTNSYTDTKLTGGKTYKYRVAAVRTKAGHAVTGTVSSTQSVSIKKSPGSTVKPVMYKVTFRSKAPAFTSSKSKKKVATIKKGTNATTYGSSNGRFKVKLSNGKTYWVAKGRLRFKSTIWTTKDYSTKTKTNFVNSRKYSSKTKYLIWINQYTQRVMIYTGKKGNWKLVRSCRCAAGRATARTPFGVYKITYKEKGWFYRYTYEKPIVHFKGQNSFHSRIKRYGGGYADATIGRPRSSGCVRLYDSDINYIYKKCPKGTTVVSY